MTYVFCKKAGATFHLDEWITFLNSIEECWHQPELSDGTPGDVCRVVREFTVTVKADD